MHILRSVALIATSAFLASCAAWNEHVIQREDGYADSVKHNNMQGVVVAQEEYTSMRYRGILATISGVGPQETRYRRVVVNFYNPDGGMFLGLHGEMQLLVMVPDGFPILRGGDVVEMRTLGLYGYQKNFISSGDGAAVLRILCPRNERNEPGAAMHACGESLAWYDGWGEKYHFWEGIVASPSGRPWLPSLKDHTELSFTPYYDDAGNVLPTAVPPAPHPSIMNWPDPRRY